MKLKNKTAIITGASQGLGHAIAAKFVAEGANVVLIARNAGDLAKAADEFSKSAAGQIVAHAADVADEARMTEIIGQTIEKFGTVEILVNNAGVYGPIGPIEENDFKEWRYAFDVNFYGSLIPIRLLLPHFKRNNFGRIINLSGGGATKGMPSFSSYACAKTAIVRMTETVALETKDLNITVNAIAPGALNTRLLDEVLKAGPSKAGGQFYDASIKQKETGGSSPENAADLCVFLATTAGITGRLISAVWDDWQNLPPRAGELDKTDIYTLRRITAKDRGRDWDDNK